MAKSKSTLSRVDYWATYRATIKEDFERAKKSAKKEKVKAKKAEKPIKSRKVLRAEALLKEYEKQNGTMPEEVRKEGNNLLVGLAIILFLLIAAGIIFMIWRYR